LLHVTEKGSFEPGSSEHMATEKQAEILEFIRSYQETEQVPPSSRQVQQRFSYGSQTTAVRHLKALAEAGHLEQFADGRWGVKRSTKSTSQFVEVPVYGSIPAGAPAFREQTPEEVLPFDRRMFRHQGELWAVRIQGESMIDAHIAEGDLAILEKREPRDGEIIAALVDGNDTTLKRYLVVDGRAVLRASNKKYEDIFPRTLESQGVLVAIFRRLVT
jgi:repressor LexA